MPAASRSSPSFWKPSRSNASISPELIIEDNQKRAQIQADSAASDGLFVYSAQRGPRTVYDEPTESRLWRTYQRNVDALNNLVETSGASDRNQLLLVALRAHLDPRS